MDDANGILISGDYMRNVLPEDDPKWDSFYEKYPQIKNSELDVSPSTDKTPQDYNNHFFDAEWARIQDQRLEISSSKPGYCKIGTVALTVPPAQIAISDVKNNLTYAMLRSRGDVTLQSGHTNKIIELDIIFHDIDSINNKLRPLLAQLRCTPFIPIENEYIRAVIVPQDIRVKAFSAERENRVDDLLKSRDAWKEQIEQYEREIKEIINQTTFYKIGVGDTESEKERKQQDETSVKTRLALFVDGVLDPRYRGQIELDRSIAYNVDKELGIAENKEEATDTSESGIVRRIEDIETKKNSYREKVFDTLRDLPGNRSSTEVIPTVLSQITISTVPGSPEALACHLSLFVFNCLPYSPNFVFRKTLSEEMKICPSCNVENTVDAIKCASCQRTIKDSNENIRSNIAPTKQIDECDSFVKWYSKEFLSDADKAIKRVSLKPTNHVNFETTRSSRRIVKGKSRDYQALISLDTANYLSAECVSVAISFSNRIKFLPILGYGVPTCQFLGSNSATVALTFSSFPEKDHEEDIFLESMRFFFNQVDATSRETIKNNRRAWVRIDNDIVNMFGIENLVTQSFDVNTIPGSPGMSAITLRFIDINTTFEEREKIMLLDVASDERIDAFIENEIKLWRNGESPVIDGCLDELDTTGYRDAFIPRVSTWALFSTVSGHLADKRDDLIWASGPKTQFIYRYYANAAKASGYSLKKKKYVDEGVDIGLKKQMRLDSTVFDTIYAKKDGSFKEKPLDRRVREDIFNKVKSEFSKDGLGDDEVKNKVIDKDIARLLFRSTETGQEKIDDWSELLKLKAAGQGNFPENVEEILEREKTSMQRNPSYWTYGDLSLPVYDEVGIGYAPSFSDLGIATPRNFKPQSKARHKYDIVEPDFYFDHIRIKDSVRGAFNYDAGSWGASAITYSDALVSAARAHSAQGSKMKDEVKDSIDQQGTVADKEKSAEVDQERAGMVDKQSGPTGSSWNKSAEVASRVPVENMSPSDTLEGFVDRVVDGDTITIKGYDEKIRIIGINAPEIKYTKDGNSNNTYEIDDANSDRGAVEAKKYLESLVLNKNVKLRVDQFNLHSKHRGKHGRPLMYVFLVGEGGAEEDIGGRMLDEGLAEAKSDFMSAMYGDYGKRSDPKHKTVEKKDVYDNTVLGPASFKYGAKGLKGPAPDLENLKDKNQQ